jgi:hypothetical protein
VENGLKVRSNYKITIGDSGDWVEVDQVGQFRNGTWYVKVRLRRESSMEECRKTSGIQVLDEPLELSFIDHSMG